MRGRPFELGNTVGRGRPAGRRNKKTLLQELLESHGKALITQVQILAMKGDPTAMRLCIERLLPVCKPPASRFRLPPLHNAADSMKALPAVMREVAQGRLSAQDGEAMARMIESYRRTLEAEEFDKRLKALEEAPKSSRRNKGNLP
jgi:hypothetical protein